MGVATDILMEEIVMDILMEEIVMVILTEETMAILTEEVMHLLYNCHLNSCTHYYRPQTQTKLC